MSSGCVSRALRPRTEGVAPGSRPPGRLRHLPKSRTSQLSYPATATRQIPPGKSRKLGFAPGGPGRPRGRPQGRRPLARPTVPRLPPRPPVAGPGAGRKSRPTRQVRLPGSPPHPRYPASGLPGSSPQLTCPATQLPRKKEGCRVAHHTSCLGIHWAQHLQPYPSTVPPHTTPPPPHGYPANITEPLAAGIQPPPIGGVGAICP
jgi:hypothetical protein